MQKSPEREEELAYQAGNFTIVILVSYAVIKITKLMEIALSPLKRLCSLQVKTALKCI